MNDDEIKSLFKENDLNNLITIWTNLLTLVYLNKA